MNIKTCKTCKNKFNPETNPECAVCAFENKLPKLSEKALTPEQIEMKEYLKTHTYDETAQKYSTTRYKLRYLFGRRAYVK